MEETITKKEGNILQHEEDTDDFIKHKSTDRLLLHHKFKNTMEDFFKRQIILIKKKKDS